MTHYEFFSARLVIIHVIFIFVGFPIRSAGELTCAAAKPSASNAFLLQVTASSSASHSDGKFLMGVYREGPTKHIDAVNMMLQVAADLGRTLVEPCYTRKAILGRCTEKGPNRIPFCEVFACPDTIEHMIRYEAFKTVQRENFTLSMWASSTKWGFRPNIPENVLSSNSSWQRALKDTSDVMVMENIICCLSKRPHAKNPLTFSYNLNYISKEKLLSGAYAVLQWRSERDLTEVCDFDQYLKCAEEFRAQIVKHSEGLDRVYVIWDAHLEDEHNWPHLNTVVPKAYREAANKIVMKDLEGVKLERIMPSGDVVKDMMIDHVIGSHGKKLVQCLEGWCLKCSFSSGFSRKLKYLFEKNNPETPIITYWEAHVTNTTV